MAVKKGEFLSRLKTFPPTAVVGCKNSTAALTTISRRLTVTDPRCEGIIQTGGEASILIDMNQSISSVSVERLIKALERIPDSATVGLAYSDDPTVPMPITNSINYPMISFDPCPISGGQEQVVIWYTV